MSEPVAKPVDGDDSNTNPPAEEPQLAVEGQSANNDAGDAAVAGQEESAAGSDGEVEDDESSSEKDASDADEEAEDEEIMTPDPEGPDAEPHQPVAPVNLRQWMVRVAFCAFY